MAEGRIQTEGLLFELVQSLRIFPDSKTFPDSIPTRAPEVIEREFAAFIEPFEQQISRFFDWAHGAAALNARDVAPELAAALEEWVRERFILPAQAKVGTRSMEAHIEDLWGQLLRVPPALIARSSLIPLEHPYVVPGGRFIEMYYWDSYFTCVGLLAAGHTARVRNVADNFVQLIHAYGFVPNGNRTYYLGRSQAPFFSFLIELLRRIEGIDVDPCYEALAKEHRFWMDETQGESRRRVTLSNGTALNRYWDQFETPRPEGYWEDAALCHEAGHTKDSPEGRALFRHLRAAAESGWDFSSRWLARDEQGQYRLQTIRTTDVLPVDLNALLYHAECRLAEWCQRSGQKERANDFSRAARQRRQAMMHRFWDDQLGWFFDYVIPENRRSDVWSLAGAYPLFCGLLEPVQDRDKIDRIVQNIERRFLQPGGVVTTLTPTGQQWDMPNGWAPLQWITVAGLINYNRHDLAREIARRFVRLARQVYDRTGRMTEKYDVCDLTQEAGGGEYPNQDGFGWTNGVVKAFMEYLDGSLFWLPSPTPGDSA